MDDFFGLPLDEGYTNADLIKVSAQLRAFPLPAHLTPTTVECLNSVEDEVLLKAPPHLICHIQRTVAQGGMQVISPRQVPFTKMMCRVGAVPRVLGDHVVGSIAATGAEWPTIDNADMSFLLPDEPLTPANPTNVMREKTRSEPLTKASKLLSDPILSCLVKGRAVIDVLARNDVAGGWHEMAEILANAWGIAPDELMDLDAFTLGYDGQLLRHAIQADDVFPTTYAPIHQRRCVSVGSVDASRAHLPEDSALDWRRLRVFCEAVFLLSCNTEGIPLSRVTANPPPGDPSAPLGRSNTIAFRIAPCTVWSFETRTFSICPEGMVKKSTSGGVPMEVLEALARYAKIARPVSHALRVGSSTRTRSATVEAVTAPPGESIREAYHAIVNTVRVGNVRGKSVSAALRNMLYEMLESAPIAERMRIVRYMRIAREEVQIHLRMDVVPDSMIDFLALRFQTLGEHIRSRIASEAAKRSETIETWWADATAQTPTRYQAMSEGTLGWAKVALWLAFRAPTYKWDNLVSAVHMKALRAADVSSVGSLPLPAEIGSAERLVAACRAATKSLSATYSSYYSGVADVAHAIAAELARAGAESRAGKMKEAAFLWTFRARALRGTNVSHIEKGSMPSSENHILIGASPVDVVVVPAPYKAFTCYRAHALSSPHVLDEAKTMLKQPVRGRVSHIFEDMDRPIAVLPTSRVTRYLLNPKELGFDLNRAWGDLASDIRTVAKMYSEEPVHKSKQSRRTEELVTAGADLVTVKKPRTLEFTGTSTVNLQGFYSVYCDLNEDQASFIDDFLESLPDNEEDEIRERQYKDVDDLLRVVRAASDAHMPLDEASIETVR